MGGKRLIADNPSFAKLRQDAEGMEALVAFRPLLTSLGVKIDDELVAEVEALAKKTADLLSIPDRFNDLFAERGWIAYELLKMDVMRKAVEVGESGDLDAAEAVLVDHYDQETIEWGIKFLWAVKSFEPRERLARLALADYLEGRYHAVIPVLLMIIDGMVNDIEQARGFSRGFFAEGGNLTAWDSIAAHSRGLQALKELWTRGRTKTTAEPITVPYRHGILHGRDLAYDSQLVAAKCWGALFALREWALAVRDGKLEEPAPKPERSLLETLHDYQESKARDAKQQAWTPRDSDALAAVPATAEPDAYPPDSPEQALSKLMALWKRRNYGHMVPLLHLPAENGRPVGPQARELRDLLHDKNLQGFAITEIVDVAPAITRWRVDVDYEKDGERRQAPIELAAICIDANGSPMLRGEQGATWRISQFHAAAYKL
jgi:hypothetical protein